MAQLPGPTRFLLMMPAIFAMILAIGGGVIVLAIALCLLAKLERHRLPIRRTHHLFGFHWSGPYCGAI